MGHRPHVSEALAQLRHGVSFAAALVALCAVVQMLVFGFVHFTEVRFSTLKPVVAERDLTVVLGQPAPKEPEPTDALASAAEASPSQAMTPVQTLAGVPSGEGDIQVWVGDKLRDEPAAPRVPAAVNTVRTTWDQLLYRASNLAVTGGVIGALALAALTGLGTVVAGGGAIPGSGKAASSCTWAMFLGLVAVPWVGVLPAMPLQGVFGSFESMAAASAVSGGGGAAIAQFLVLPTMIVAMALFIALRFRAGVEQGVILTSVSEAEEVLEREMALIRSGGVGTNVGGRTHGALTRTIGSARGDGSASGPPVYPAPAYPPAPAQGYAPPAPQAYAPPAPQGYAPAPQAAPAPAAPAYQPPPQPPQRPLMTAHPPADPKPSSRRSRRIGELNAEEFFKRPI